LGDIINGRLCGGAKDDIDKFTKKEQMMDSVRSALAESTSSSSATVKVLARLGSWFLFPVAYDAESCGYKHEGSSSSSLSSSSSEKLFDLFPLKEPTDEEDESSSSESEDGSSDDSGDGSVTIASHDELSKTSKQQIPSELDVSISEIAEAYYAHQATEELSVFDGIGYYEDSIYNNNGPTSSSSSSSTHRLDYVITQMDIARMARNASRHLDVDSILNLPTVTYHQESKTTSSIAADNKRSIPRILEDQANSQEQQDNNEGWSWMMVPQGRSTQEQRQTPLSSLEEEDVPKSQDESSTDDACVICLEHFVDGDRLRVLPCDHSFHMGCIDRWLSGSHSHEECFTSGCPTCKKRPGMQNEFPTSSDGSVPSWAFTRLGGALSRQSTV
jgi:hypothetical protein